MNEVPNTVPMHVRLRIIHGVLQRLGEQCGADLLHIKGPTLSPEVLRPRPGHGDVPVRRASSDADVFVRPEHIDAFLATTVKAGWIQKTKFYDGSAFGHAVNIYHPHLGNADIHRAIPGFAGKYFDLMWADRRTIQLGHVDCAVPSLTGQRLILALHGARSGPHHADRWYGWESLDETERDDVRALAHASGGEIGLAVLEDRLGEFTQHPDYRLWAHFGTGDTSRLDEWKARWTAAQSFSEKLGVLRSFTFMNDAVIENELGRPPTKKERLARHKSRVVTLMKEVASRVVRSP